MHADLLVEQVVALQEEGHAARQVRAVRELRIDPRISRRGRLQRCHALLREGVNDRQVRAEGAVTKNIADEALNLLNVDPLGLDEVDRRVLATIIEKYNGGPVGLNTIAASIGEEPDTIMDVVEPYLLQLGFLDRTPQGRVATKRAYDHLNLPYIERGQQPGLFNL